MKNSVLVTIATADYIPQVKQLFASAHEAGYWQGQYLVIIPEVGAQDRAWFDQKGILVRSYEPVISQEEWNALRLSKGFNRIVMEKFHMFREEFKQWDKIFYVDCDVIITGPLIRLTRKEGFCCTIDSSFYLRKQYAEGYELLEREGYNLNRPSLSAGQFVLSADIIKPETYGELIALSKKFLGITNFGEQSIFNLYFYNRWNKMSLGYGFALTIMPSAFMQQPKDALVLHFALHSRPWEPQSPYNALWKDNLKKAEEINFRTPRKANFRIKVHALIKEKLFIPWRFYLSRFYWEYKTAITENYGKYKWYQVVKKWFHLTKRLLSGNGR